jgi:hypothetical protein
MRRELRVRDAAGNFSSFHCSESGPGWLALSRPECGKDEGNSFLPTMSLDIRQSRIHSFGCYTTRPIKKGALVVEYIGERLSPAQAEDLYDDAPHTYLFALDGGKHILDGFGVAAFINHSCDPNCETDQIRGKIWVIAARDIKPGEELTYDYNLYDGEDEAPCLCGARRCRGSLYSREHLRKLARIRAKSIAAIA